MLVSVKKNMKFFGVVSLCVLSLLVNLHPGTVEAQWAPGAAALGTGLAGYSSILPAAGLGLFNPLKGSGALLGLVAAKLGLMGPMKFALLSKASFALGAIGTALGGAALKVSLRNKNNGYYNHGYHDNYDSYSHYDAYDHSGDYYRKKRDTSESVNYLDERNFDYVQKSDPKRCTERLICELSAKSRRNKEPMAIDEMAILSMVKSKNSLGYKSKAHHLYEIAARQGTLHNNCPRVFSSCGYTGDELMSLIRFLGSGFDSEDPRDVIKYVRS